MTDLWTIEQRLWLDGVEAYEELMATECVMAFGPTGILRNDAIVESIRQAPRWSDVELLDRAEVHHGRDIAVLAYRAHGERITGPAYEAVCTSTYIRENDKWRIAQHQQTPLS